MAEEEIEGISLIGERKRQAADSLRGYLYQIWHSVHAWIDLADNEVLFLEGAEDFDILEAEKATTVQVKDTEANITLRSRPVTDAIIHYWQLRNENLGRRVSFRFLTRSGIGIENGKPFGAIAGLSLWKRCQRGLETGEAVDALRRFLLKEIELPQELREFLTINEVGEISEQLIRNISWETKSQDAGFVQEAIEEKLIVHGDKYGIPPTEAKRVVNRLLKEAFAVATRKEKRFLHRALFLQIFEEETTTKIPVNQLEKLNQIVHSQFSKVLFLGPLSSYSEVPIQALPLIRPDIPPLPPKISKRTRVTASFVSYLENSGVLLLIGSVGIGKSTLAKLVARAIGNEWYWLSDKVQDIVYSKKGHDIVNSKL